jgi:hypothetical protein
MPRLYDVTIGTGSELEPGWWASTVEGVPLGQARWNGSANATSAALNLQWSWFGQPGQEVEFYGWPDVVSASAESLPVPPSGNTVIKLDHAIGDSRVHHKLYKLLTINNWPGGAEPAGFESNPPTNVSARYITYMYMPSSGPNIYSLQGHNFGILTAFKQSIETSGGFFQDPTWWVSVDNFDGPYPLTLRLACAGLTHSGPGYNFANYMDRWVKYEYRVYQGDRVEWYMDGVLKDTGLHSTKWVGPPSHFSSTYAGHTITLPREWIYESGNYTSNQAFSGPGQNEPDYNYADTTVYVDLAYIRPLGT